MQCSASRKKRLHPARFFYNAASFPLLANKPIHRIVPAQGDAAPREGGHNAARLRDALPARKTGTLRCGLVLLRYADIRGSEGGGGGGSVVVRRWSASGPEVVRWWSCDVLVGAVSVTVWIGEVPVLWWSIGGP